MTPAERQPLTDGREPHRPGTPRRSWHLGLAAIFLLGLGAYLFVAHSGRAQQRAVPSATPAARPVAVAAVAAKRGDLPVYLTGLGSVTPSTPSP